MLIAIDIVGCCDGFAKSTVGFSCLVLMDLGQISNGLAQTSTSTSDFADYCNGFGCLVVIGLVVFGYKRLTLLIR